MPNLNMNGIFELKESVINKEVSKTSAGNYALGYQKDKENGAKVFFVNYVGRSDSDVNDRLKDHIGNYECFKFSYAKSAKEAFEKECDNYHDFNPGSLNNDKHPDSPDGLNLKCHRCK